MDVHVTLTVSCALLFLFFLQRMCCFLGDEEPSSPVPSPPSSGRPASFCLQQGQPEPAVQHVRVEGPDPAQVPDDVRRVHPQGRHLEFAK